jgi:hypothetical protein
MAGISALAGVSPSGEGPYTWPVRVPALVVSLALLVGLAVATGAQAGAAASEPSALLRPATPADVLPARFRNTRLPILESRLVASYTRAKTKVRLYLVRTADGMLCNVMIIDDRGSGTGCRLPATFFGSTGLAPAAVSGRFFSGVAPNEATSMVVVGRKGDRHQIRLSADHAFIVGCSGPDACACAVAWVEVLDSVGTVLSRTKWLAPRCWRLP